jgi:hypothetical protein
VIVRVVPCHWRLTAATGMPDQGVGEGESVPCPRSGWQPPRDAQERYRHQAQAAALSSLEKLMMMRTKPSTRRTSATARRTQTTILARFDSAMAGLLGEKSPGSARAAARGGRVRTKG